MLKGHLQIIAGVFFFGKKLFKQTKISLCDIIKDKLFMYK